MRKSLWVMAGFAAAVAVFFAFASQRMVMDVTGVEEAKELQGLLRGAYSPWLAEEPALRVWRVPPSEGRAFSWRVEATLRPGKDPASPETRRGFVDRMLQRCLATKVMGVAPASVRIVLHGADGSVITLDYDGQGRLAAPAPPPPPGGGGR